MRGSDVVKVGLEHVHFLPRTPKQLGLQAHTVMSTPLLTLLFLSTAHFLAMVHHTLYTAFSISHKTCYPHRVVYFTLEEIVSIRYYNELLV